MVNVCLWDWSIELVHITSCIAAQQQMYVYVRDIYELRQNGVGHIERHLALVLM